MEMPQPRAADDFAAIKARMRELQRERQQVAAGDEVVAQRTEATRTGTMWPHISRSHPVIRRLLPRHG